MSVGVGDRAPDFALASSKGAEVKLSDFVGKKNVVLFFYPKDETAGCTAEACSFRDAYEDFVEAGAEVIGVSSDSPESHAQFAGKHSLPMVLLSDQGGRVRDMYGVKPTLGIIPGRVTYVIDRQGVVRHMFRSQLRVHQHVKETLSILKTLQ
jgi:peroxiredoxin Q/BCP